MDDDPRLEVLDGIVRARRMIRAFTDEPVDAEVLTRLLELTRRAPSAGNTQAWELLVLEGDETEVYWEATLGARRMGFGWPGLLRAPVLVVVYVRPVAYVDRYAEADKAATGLGDSTESWTVPYWWVDGGAAVENLLLAATAAGLGACLFGQFEHEDSVRRAFAVPDDRRAIGTVAIGHPDTDTDASGRSAGRARPGLDEIVHRGQWRRLS